LSYKVKEIFLTIQGEGVQAGRAAVFCRFSGCTLWSGHEKDRTKAKCPFCDTDFAGTDGPGGGIFQTPTKLIKALLEKWTSPDVKPFVVFTGGEPLLQIDSFILEALRKNGIETAIETNGTFSLPGAMDWVCVSPKAGTEFVLTNGDELKLVFPQEGIDPAAFLDFAFDHFLLQPMDGPQLKANTDLAIAYIKKHPQWKLSLQTHKFIQIP